jgi:hypothetical protein
MPLPTRSPAQAGPQAGMGLIECLVSIPLLLFAGLAIVQLALLYYAKSQLNYACFEAARSGSTAHARPAVLLRTLVRSMTGYYGGGRDRGELLASYERARADLSQQALRIEILSPSTESFDDYESPELTARIGKGSRVIPNLHLAHLRCPRDRPGCANDPARNASGQTLSDANLLKLRVTYGVPVQMQVPVIGRFMAWALTLYALVDDSDAFRLNLLRAGRLPLVAHATLRMQSEAIENELITSIPGRGQAAPTDPGFARSGHAVPACASMLSTCHRAGP